MGRSVESSALGSSDDPVFIPVYLAAAAPTIQTINDLGAVEAERARVEAVRALHTIYRAQLTAAPIDDRLIEFLQERAAVIWASPDPLEAMKQLWSPAAKRGRPHSNIDRDFKLCVEIETRVRAGEEAEQVFVDFEESKSHGALSSGTIANIFSRRDKKAINAQLDINAKNATELTTGEIEAKSREFFSEVDAARRSTERLIKADLDKERTGGKSRAHAEIHNIADCDGD